MVVSTNGFDDIFFIYSLLEGVRQGSEPLYFMVVIMAETGRPRKWKSVAELQKQIDEYFEQCETEKEPLTVTGLALALDTTRDVIMDYQRLDEGEPDGFSNAIKKAKLRIEHAYEKRNIRRGNGGDIFALKNFGWKDKQEVDLGMEGEIRINLGDAGKWAK